MSRPLSCAVAVLVLAGSAATARAAGERVALRWDGPESCPADSFSASVERYLGPRAGDGPPLSVRVRVREHGPGRWSLDLDAATSATTGTRHLEADSCETVLDAAAFVVAQAIAAASGDEPAAGPGEPPPAAAPERDSALVPEPGSAEPLQPSPSRSGSTAPSRSPVGATAPPGSPAGATAPSGSPAGATAPPGSLVGAPAAPGPSEAAGASGSPQAVEGPEAAPAGVAPVARRPPRLRAAIRLTEGISGVALPAVSNELGLGVALLGARWRAEVVAHGRLPARVRAPDQPSIGADLSLWAVGVRGCAVPRVSRPAPSLRTFEFPLCAGAEVGQVLARSVGLAVPGRVGLVWAAITAAPGVQWVPRPWLAVGLQVELAAPLLRHEFVIRGLPPLHRLGPVDVRGLLGVEFRLGGAPARPRGP
ncbi:hypothetical protein [Nannocystis punicea]|uniref:Uncharacterized protein n=1 Tax=Nannocystis punicea TaxID=2995304 RepID=A0ABY7H8W8_9BACT|nr:hypothetical protein [Nannocystis poenicansa]WAS95545.1 hypothetical protein O0S08_05230 [Nannocystis poenicansa]